MRFSFIPILVKAFQEEQGEMFWPDWQSSRLRPARITSIFTNRNTRKNIAKVIDKELPNQLLKLEADQQGMVLTYIKNLLTNEEMDRRAEASEKAIESGKIVSFDQFNSDFENWKNQKRRSIL